MVQFVESLDDFKGHLASAGSKLVIVDFTASWCGPCQYIAPIFAKMAEENPDVVFLKVDVDEAADIAQEYKIRAMPTFFFFKNGEKVADLCGANDKELKAMMEKLK